MKDITSNGQQGDEKNSHKRKTLHGASKVGPISSALRRHSCALDSVTLRADAEHPLRIALAL
jgi:hypothetical protein